VILIKWILRIIGIATIAFFGFVAYELNFGRTSTRPDIPPGAFDLMFDQGFNAILVGIPDERNSRDYFSSRFDVPSYLEDAWSFCRAPTDAERADYEKNAADSIPRFDALCSVDVDGKIIMVGAITSVPKL
jgi:hypothetical protein